VTALDPPSLPKPFLIGIDGRDGAGKISFAAGSLGSRLPAVFPDLFVAPSNLNDDRGRHSASIAG
jgi:hypothetical protein